MEEAKVTKNVVTVVNHEQDNKQGTSGDTSEIEKICLSVDLRTQEKNEMKCLICESESIDTNGIIIFLIL